MDTLYSIVPKRRTQRFEIRTICVNQDLDRIWKWWNAPHVLGSWSMEFRLGALSSEKHKYRKEDLHEYLTCILETKKMTPLIGRLGGEDFMYLEVYRIGDSNLAGQPGLDPEDWGYHLIVGEPKYAGSGIGVRLIGPEVRDWLLQSRPEATQIVIEPNVNNQNAIRAALRVPGAHRLEDVQLPHKRAALIVFKPVEGASGRTH